jgi:hypothetical protein
MRERFWLRCFVGLSVLCSFLAAAPSPRATTAPPPPASPAATLPPSSSFSADVPEVLVYPFDVQAGIDARIGMAIAQILAQEMTAAGGINVPPVPRGVKRADFLDNARASHADFYISGYVTPVGDSAAVVEQVVSVDSGVILFSQTAQVSSVADVASQSLLARSQILAFVNRGSEQVETQASATPAPASTTNGAKVPINGIDNIVGSVFKHKGAGPSPKASAPPVSKPSRGVIVAPVAASGTIAPADLSDALRELYFAMNRHFSTQMTSVTADVSQSADAICGSNRDNTIATGTLEETPAHHGHQVVFTLRVYTCFGATLEHEVGKGNSIKTAVDAAATAYATAHPDNS